MGMLIALWVVWEAVKTSFHWLRKRGWLLWFVG